MSVFTGTQRVDGRWTASAIAWALEVVRRIAVLMNNAENDTETKTQLFAFRQGLQQLGWSEIVT